MSTTTQRNNLIFDFEVFPNWWCCCTRSATDPDNYGVVTSDDEFAVKTLKTYISQYRLVGFNIKNYDLFILYGIICGLSQNEVYNISEDIIHGNKTPWTSHFAHYKWAWIDLYNDWKYGSLKMYEATQGMSITESSVPFGKETLSADEKAEIIEYCHADTYASYLLFEERKGYFSIHGFVSKNYNVPEDKAYQKTMASLAAEAMHAQKPLNVVPEDKRGDIYVLPYIYEQLDNVDPFKFLLVNSTDTQVYSYKGDVFKLGVGGVHSDYEQPIIVSSDKYNTLYSIDVTQYYPNMLVNFNLMPRSVTVSGVETFKDMIRAVRELKVKVGELEEQGDFAQAAELKSDRDKYKVLINAVSGAMRNKYSKFYDPSRIITMCAVGEFLLISVVMDIKKHFPGTEILQTNTDGAYLLVPNQFDLPAKVAEINDKLGFTFEVEKGRTMIQNNVNNYVFIKDNGKIKTKGSWLYAKRPKLNPPAYPIAHIAAFNKLVYGTPIRDTVYGCRDIMDFAMCCKSGSTFDRTVYCVGGIDYPANNTNRFVVTKGTDATLYKIKGESRNRIADCPNNITLINEDVRTYDIDKLGIDYEFYVQFANDLLPNFMCF